MSVADILQAMAQNAGRAKLQRGDLLAGTIAGLSQVPANIINDRARAAEIARQQAIVDENQQFKRDDRAHQAANDAREDAQRQADQERKDALQAAILAGFGGSNNPKDFDVEKAVQAVKESGHPELATAIAETHKKFAPEPVKTREVKTIDAGGIPVTSLVPDVPGTSYPEPPKEAPKLTYGQPVAAIVNGKRTLIRAGSDGKTYGMTGQELDASQIQPDVKPSNVINLNNESKDNIKEAVTAMKEGTAPPMLPGRATKEYLATIAEARRQGYDIATAATDWNATQKHIATMNGAQQLRLNQAINSLPDMLDSVDELASQWKGGKFPILNKANLALAKNGAYGSEVASIANKLDAQIADVTADLGNVYMGGNSPTDHALSLAAKSLNGAWDEKVLHDMVQMAKKNVTIRQNSIKNTGVAGASESNPYGAQPAQATTPAPAAKKPTAAELIKKYGG